MKRRRFTIRGIFCFLQLFLAIPFCTGIFAQQPDSIIYRDPYKWPFSVNSIWNMPIGSGARYVHAGIEKSTKRGMTIDEDVIVTMPGEEFITVFKNFAGWDRSKDRCEPEDDFIFAAPTPYDFIVSPSIWDGLTPNSGYAVVMADGLTVMQTQPFAHCEKGSVATSRSGITSTSIYGDGYYGAHGGSRLSAIGGTLRYWELNPESGPVRHALKVNLYCQKNVLYESETKGFRWPALTADGAASKIYGTERTSPPVKELRMGSLLALPPWIDLDSLGFETEPARILAETFRDYGAYVVDNSGWDVYALVTDWTPEGRFAEEFQKNWGFSFKEKYKNSPWGRDMDRIFLNLHVVDNNSADSIGGGGEPRVPFAPPFLPTVSISLETSGIDDVRFTRPDNFKTSINRATKVLISPTPMGHTFIGWEVTEGDAVIESPFEIGTMLLVKEKDSKIKANFLINLYPIISSVTGGGTISLYPEKEEYAYGSEISLEAVADSGWIFKAWEGYLSGTDNPIDIIIEGITEINAVFEQEVVNGISYKDAKEDIILTQDRRNHLVSLRYTAQNPGTQIEVYDVLGKQVFIKEMSNESRIDIKTEELGEGIYFIRFRTNNKVIDVKRFIR